MEPASQPLDSRRLTRRRWTDQTPQRCSSSRVVQSHPLRLGAKRSVVRPTLRRSGTDTFTGLKFPFHRRFTRRPYGECAIGGDPQGVCRGRQIGMNSFGARMGSPFARRASAFFGRILGKDFMKARYKISCAIAATLTRMRGRRLLPTRRLRPPAGASRRDG